MLLLMVLILMGIVADSYGQDDWAEWTPENHPDWVEYSDDSGWPSYKPSMKFFWQNDTLCFEFVDEHYRERFPRKFHGIDLTFFDPDTRFQLEKIEDNEFRDGSFYWYFDLEKTSTKHLVYETYYLLMPRAEFEQLKSQSVADYHFTLDMEDFDQKMLDLLDKAIEEKDNEKALKLTAKAAKDMIHMYNFRITGQETLEYEHYYNTRGALPDQYFYGEITIAPENKEINKNRNF